MSAFWSLGLSVFLLASGWIAEASGLDDDFCPAYCVCSSQTILCRQRTLTEMPRLPNYLPGIEGGAFQYFAMQGTHMVHIPPGAFMNHLDLVQIQLNSNNISEVSETAFSNLPALRKLSLSRNRIQVLPELIFIETKQLVQLDLSENLLTKLPSSLEDLVNLKQLLLTGNPLHCPCSIAGLTINLAALEQAHHNVICETPNEVVGKRLSDMGKALVRQRDGSLRFGIQPDQEIFPQGSETYEEDDDYIVNEHWPHCSVDELAGPGEQDEGTGATAPSISKAPQGISVTEGERTFYTCEATGSPLPTITWILPTNRTRYYRLWKNNRVLEIKETHDYHNGTYACVAKNDHGTAKSSASLKIIYASKARILDAPASNTVGPMAGGTLGMNCVARGRPRPKISWIWVQSVLQKPLVTSGRYIVRSDERNTGDDSLLGSERAGIFGDSQFEQQVSSTLFLRNITERDTEGRYICYVTNRIGSARVSTVVSLMKSQVPTDFERHDSSVMDKDRMEQRHSSDTDAPSSPTSSAETEDLVRDVIERARKRIDMAIKKTADRLRDPARARSSSDIASLFRQPSKAALELAKAAEVYEAAIDEVTQLLRQKHVNALGKDENFVYRGDEDRDEEKRQAMGVQLTAEQLAIIAQLSGCAQSQRVEPCDRQLCFHLRYRSIDGSCNNLHFPRWGAALSPFHRLLTPVYENGVNTPIGWSADRLYFGYPKPSARLVSSVLLGNATKLIIHTEKLREYNAAVKLAATTNASEAIKQRIAPVFSMKSMGEISEDDEMFDEDDGESGMLMQWGQFLDHDLDFTPVDASTSRFSDGLGCNETCINDPPCFPILTPPNDARIKHRCIGFARSTATCGSGSTSILTGRPQHREQLNQITSFIDASNVYSSDEIEGGQLRNTIYDEGHLREGIPTQIGKRLLPFNIRGQVDCQADPKQDFVPCFKAGDHRSNENLGLLSMHTIWMREHNRLADGLRSLNPHWSGDRIFQEARKIVGASMQSITYREWLPKILGPKGMAMLGTNYPGYDDSVNPTISNEFATAAFRFGHTLVSPIVYRLGTDWEAIPEGHLLLHKAFFAPDRLLKDGGLDPILRGLLFHGVRDTTRKPPLNPELTERLFAMAHALALDLAALNVQRGRDHGLPHYTAYAYHVCGLGSSAQPDSFDDLADRIQDPLTRERLRSVYGHPANIDIFAAGVLEDLLPGARVGPTFACIIADQFRRLRAGDRLWYEAPGMFSSAQLAEIRRAGSSLSRVICENADNITEVSHDAYLRPRSRQDLVACDRIPKINLAMWKECPSTTSNFQPIHSDTGEQQDIGVRVRRSAVLDNVQENQGACGDAEMLNIHPSTNDEPELYDWY